MISLDGKPGMISLDADILSPPELKTTRLEARGQSYLPCPLNVWPETGTLGQSANAEDC